MPDKTNCTLSAWYRGRMKVTHRILHVLQALLGLTRTATEYQGVMENVDIARSMHDIIAGGTYIETIKGTGDPEKRNL